MTDILAALLTLTATSGLLLLGGLGEAIVNHRRERRAIKRRLAALYRRF